MSFPVEFLGRHFRPSVANVLILGLVLTLLNCPKPLHIDDPLYCAYAAHIARAPLDPYGFDIGATLGGSSVPAWHMVAPPVFLYWLAAGMRLFGNHVVLWKLWLLPVSLLFTGSLHALLRRFARPLELPLAWLIVVSPAVLPSLNLMLDLPALALSMSALALFLSAADRDSWKSAIVAGMIAGLAMDTKYTAFAVPAVFLGHAVLTGRWRLGLAAALTAAAIFWGWELFVTLKYGESNFLFCLRHEDTSPYSTRPHQASAFVNWGHLCLPLVALWGGVAPATLILGLIALDARRRTLAFAAGASIVAYALIALVPESCTTLIPARDVGRGPVLTVDSIAYGGLGVAFLATVGAVIRQLGRRSTSAVDCRGRWRPGATEQFLLLWLAAEIAGYFALSPFPAVRRVLGPFVVVTILFGRLAQRCGRLVDQRHVVWRVAMGGAALGLCFSLVDLREAQAQKQAARKTAQMLGKAAEGHSTWCVGGFGFLYYAERSGMKPAVRGTAVREGDRVVVIDERLLGLAPQLAPEQFRFLGNVRVTDRVPLCSVPIYYKGRRPLTHLDGPRVSVSLYRATANCTLPYSAPRWINEELYAGIPK